VLGYVNRGRREIAICALPGNVSLGRAFSRSKSSAKEFGAPPRGQWPELAIRRFLLYDVLLHELGHLQVVDRKASRARRRFASETKAQAFADYWRRELWSQPFEHPDPVHNPTSESESCFAELVQRLLL
jgi:hypothetical protein